MTCIESIDICVIQVI